MGNTAESKLSTHAFSLDSFDKTYSYEKEIHDSRFGLIKLYKNKNDGSYVMVLTKSSLDGDFQSFINELEVRTQLNHENLCRILGYTQDNMQKLCGTTSSLTIYAEYEKNNLDKELQKKARNHV